MTQKLKVLFALMLLSAASLNAQTMAEDLTTWAKGWRHAFSQEGREAWKPEFTIRGYAGLVTSGPSLTGGVRIDDKRTLGLMVSQGDTYIDAAPGSIYTISAGLYMRRYFHLGKKHIIAFYSDWAAGAGYVYKVNGKYRKNSATGEQMQLIDESPGDVLFAAVWQPGLSVRFWRSLHLFLGPTLSTNTIGVHLGVGF